MSNEKVMNALYQKMYDEQRKFRDWLLEQPQEEVFHNVVFLGLGLLMAPAVPGGLPEIVKAFPAAMNDPFHITLCGDSVKTVLAFLCAYDLGIGVYFSSRRNYRRGEEHGSAKWGDAISSPRHFALPISTIWWPLERIRKPCSSPTPSC